MSKQFLSVSAPDGSPLFMVWDRDTQSFENHNGNERWSSWDTFIADVKKSFTAKGIGFGGRYSEDGDDLINEYENIASPYVRNAGKKQDAKQKSNAVSNIMPLFFLGLFVFVLGAGIWSLALKPVLGYFGLIDYKSKTQERYERFLTEVVGCEEKKKVFADSSAKYPVFHLYICDGGVEKVWKHKIEVINKTKDGKWVLE